MQQPLLGTGALYRGRLEAVKCQNISARKTPMINVLISSAIFYGATQPPTRSPSISNHGSQRPAAHAG